MNYNTFERQTTDIEHSNTDENLLLHPMKAVWLYLNTRAAKGCSERLSAASVPRSTMEADPCLQHTAALLRRKMGLE